MTAPSKSSNASRASNLRRGGGGHGRADRGDRTGRRPVPAPGDHGPDRSPGPAGSRSSAGPGADRHPGPGGAVLPHPGRPRRGRGGPPEECGAAPRREGRPHLREQRRVRRRAPRRGTGPPGHRPAGPRTAAAPARRPAQGGRRTSRPRRSRAGRPGTRRPGTNPGYGPCAWRSPGTGTRAATLDTNAGTAPGPPGRPTRSLPPGRPRPVHRGHHRPGQDGPADPRQRGRLRPGHLCHLRAGTGRRDGRGDAPLPRPRAVRGAPGLPGQRRMRPAPRTGTVHRAHVLGRRTGRRRHLVHRGAHHPRDPPGTLAARVPRPQGRTPEVRPQLQRPAQHRHPTRTGAHLRGAAAVRIRDDGNRAPGDQRAAAARRTAQDRLGRPLQRSGPADRRPARAPVPARHPGRGMGQGPHPHPRLPRQPHRHGEQLPRRLVSHRGPGHPRRGRLPLPHRTPEEPHQPRRRENLTRAPRGHARRMPRSRRSRRVRRPRPDLRATGRRSRHPAPRREHRTRTDPHVVPRPTGRLRGTRPDRDRHRPAPHSQRRPGPQGRRGHPTRTRPTGHLT